MTREYGRVQYHPRLRIWRAYAYLGSGERVLSDHALYAEAADALRASRDME